jgi:hypothetical protein
MAAIMEMDQDVKPGTASILNWYDSTRPMFIDLVGDYAGKELFLIEGDSLLRETFEDERIDFRGKLAYPPFACWNFGEMLWICFSLHSLWRVLFFWVRFVQSGMIG